MAGSPGCGGEAGGPSEREGADLGLALGDGELPFEVIPESITQVREHRVGLLVDLARAALQQLDALQVADDVRGLRRIDHEPDLAGRAHQPAVDGVDADALARVGGGDPEGQPVAEDRGEGVAHQRPVGPGDLGAAPRGAGRVPVDDDPAGVRPPVLDDLPAYGGGAAAARYPDLPDDPGPPFPVRQAGLLADAGDAGAVVEVQGDDEVVLGVVFQRGAVHRV